jgi:hypothetical protein
MKMERKSKARKQMEERVSKMGYQATIALTLLEIRNELRKMNKKYEGL